MSESHIPQVTSTSIVHSLGYAYENDDQTNNYGCQNTDHQLGTVAA